MIEFKEIEEPETPREIEVQKYLESIQIAAKEGQLAVIEASTKDGDPVMVLVAHRHYHGEERLFLLARLFQGDPADEIEAPEGLIFTQKANDHTR